MTLALSKSPDVDGTPVPKLQKFESQNFINFIRVDERVSSIELLSVNFTSRLLSIISDPSQPVNNNKTLIRYLVITLDLARYVIMGFGVESFENARSDIFALESVCAFSFGYSLFGLCNVLRGSLG